MKIPPPTRKTTAFWSVALLALAAFASARAQAPDSVPFPTISRKASAAQVQKNKQAVHHFFVTVWTTGDLSLVDQTIEANAKDHSPLGTGEGTGSFKGIIGGFHKALSDVKADGTEMGEGDLVTHFWKISGQHTKGPLMGVPPTNKEITLSGATTVRIGPDGKITERWSQLDMLGLLVQLGLAPPPPSGKK